MFILAERWRVPDRVAERPTRDHRRSSKSGENQTLKPRCRSRSDHGYRRSRAEDRECSLERRSNRSIERRSERLGESGSRTRSMPFSRYQRNCGCNQHADVKRRQMQRKASKDFKRDSEARKSERTSSSHSVTTTKFNKFIVESVSDTLQTTNPDTNKNFSSHHYELPEFNPMAKGLSITAWLIQVEKCKRIYNWSEREVIKHALSKLAGIAKTWCQTIPIRLTWDQWSVHLCEIFSSPQNYAELLNELINTKFHLGESPELYYYRKLKLLNLCQIQGRNALDCLVHGIADRNIRLSVQAVQTSEPENILKMLQAIDDRHKKRYAVDSTTNHGN